MLKRRLIPVLFLKNGWMVRSESFNIHQFIGNPIIHVQRLIEWDVDELIVINIGERNDESFAHNRSDYPQKNVIDLLSFVSTIAEECRIPLTFGGGLRDFEQVREVIIHGADKVVLNTMLFDNFQETKKCIKTFGSQAIIASVDYKTIDGENIVFRDYGRHNTNLKLDDWLATLEDIDVGEIFINSIDRDGKACGYDICTLEKASKRLKLPIIACGGAGHQRDFWRCFAETEVSAVAAGNIFHFTENAYPRAKKYLKTKNINVR